MRLRAAVHLSRGLRTDPRNRNARRPSRDVDNDDDDGPGTFDLLGFTHYWAKSLQGNNVVKRKTAKDRFRRALRRIYEWCRLHRHDPVAAQHAKLKKKL